jgi:hypothetical protein
LKLAKSRQLFVAFFSIFLIFFGIAGSIVSFFAISFLDRYKVDDSTISEFSFAVEKGFDSISLTLDNAAIAAENIADSVVAAKDSLDSAATVTKQASDAFSEMAKLVDFSILGLKPFEGVTGYFSDTSQSLLSLSSDLLLTAESLAVNSEDILVLGADLGEASGSVKDISENISSTTNIFSFQEFYTFFNYLLIYLGVMHIMFVLIGISLLALRRD